MKILVLSTNMFEGDPIRSKEVKEVCNGIGGENGCKWEEKRKKNDEIESDKVTSNNPKSCV